MQIGEKKLSNQQLRSQLKIFVLILTSEQCFQQRSIQLSKRRYHILGTLRSETRRLLERGS